MRAIAALLATLSTVPLAGCGGETTAPEPYDPLIPTSWASAVSNPYFPLRPGTQLIYEVETEEGLEEIIVEVLDATRMIMGVEATVVRDRVYLDGGLVEDTFDWYAQDADGNVWYLGEATEELENGVVVSTEGSWEWGVDGALPGIIMWANPAAHIGERYRQEYSEGEAEDWGRVIALNQSVSVPYGDLTGCIRTEDWNALEPGVLEHKWYCPTIGVALEAVVDGNDERLELIEVTTR